MTEEALEQGKRIQVELERITEAKHAVMTYRNERLELEVKVTKGLMNYTADESTTRKFTLRSDSPLFVAIAASLEGMREPMCQLIPFFVVTPFVNTLHYEHYDKYSL